LVSSYSMESPGVEDSVAIIDGSIDPAQGVGWS
jgi:hypothetical protein